MRRGRPRTDRGRAARAATSAAAVLLVVALVLTGVRLAVLDEERFANAAGEAVSSAPVASALGGLLTDRLVAAEPDLVTVEPLVRSGATAVAGSGAAAALVRTAARQLHRTAVAGRPDTAVLRLGDLGLLTVQSLRRLSPDVARRIPADVDGRLLALEDGPAADVLADVADAARLVRAASWTTSILAVLLLLAGILLRLDRPAAVARAGFVVAGAGIATVLLHALVRSLLVDAVTAPDARAAGRAAYDAFLGTVADLGTAAVATGLLVVVATAALGRRVALTETAHHALRALRARPAGRRALAVAAAAAGLLLLVDRDLAGRLAATVGGVVLLVAGFEGVLRSVVAPRPGEPGAAGEIGGGASGGAVGPPLHPPPARRRLRPRGRVAAAGVAVVLGFAAIGAATGEALDPPAGAAEGCNGSRALCDAPLDRVAMPATHNSYSSSRDGFLLANQQTGIADQLEGGIRGFLIDTHDGQRTGGRVFTRLAEDGSSRGKIEASIGPDATRTALRLRERLGGGGSAPLEPFLCHGFCELGAVPLGSALRTFRDFLLAHPGEVVVLSVEDEVAPDRFADAVREAGLLDLIWRGPVTPLPTLGAMVRAGGRVLVLVENDAGDVPWLHPQFATAQETPYDLQTPADLLGDPGCAVGRGGTAPPMLLLNHFLGTVPPRAGAAAEVNARRAILEQVDRCRRLRGRTANLLAVDFWRTGDVVGAARALNARLGG